MMKRLLNSLLTVTGVLALVAVMSPIDASADRSYRKAKKKCYTSHHNTYRSHGHVRHQQHYHHPRRTYSRRIITHPHYGGPIYYRNSGLYIRTAPRVYTTRRYYAPSYSTSRTRCYRR